MSFPYTFPFNFDDYAVTKRKRWYLDELEVVYPRTEENIMIFTPDDEILTLGEY